MSTGEVSVVLNVLRCVNKRLNSQIKLQGADLVTYYLSQHAAYGVNWFLPKKSSRSSKYAAMLRQAVELECPLDVFKPILSRVSKNQWSIPRVFVMSAIKHDRLDVFEYIAEKYQKYPIYNYLRECVAWIKPRVAKFIASRPPIIQYMMNYNPETYTNELSVHVSTYTIKREEAIRVIESYPLMTPEQQLNVRELFETLISTQHISEFVIKHTIRLIYTAGDYSDLIDILLKGVELTPLKIPINTARVESNKVLSKHVNVKFFKYGN
ncbi:hypothetical protein F-liban_138 [Faustovirus]|nr:hypothetical protein F-liban_138 [Faustovirus]SME64813.1 Hypothetical protein FSTVST1_133 [Faustovirus ST1]